MRRQTPMTLGTLFPWWLLFAALLAAVALHQKSFDVAMGYSSSDQSGPSVPVTSSRAHPLGP